MPSEGSLHDTADLLSDAEYRALAAAWAYPPRQPARERAIVSRKLRADEPILVVRTPAMSKRDRVTARKTQAKRRRKHCARVQATLGFTWDLSVVRELRLRARREAWAWRVPEA